MTLFPKQLTYVKEFDSIRAIAVLLVILAHWFPGSVTSGFSFCAIGLDISHKIGFCKLSYYVFYRLYFSNFFIFF
jgi:peptidoglycan/LPS O-acetylase OafA/YrhL